MRTWQSQDACALSRHCEPCKQSSWSRARNLQENRSLLTAKALNLHPSKCQVPNHSWVDWWGWWEADGKLDGKIARVGPQALNQEHNHYTTHTHIHTHTHSHTHTHIHTHTHTHSLTYTHTSMLHHPCLVLLD